MKSIPSSTILLVAGASLATLIAAVFISVNYYMIQPKDLAKAIQDDPEAFAEAFFSIGDDMRKYARKKQKEDLEKKFEEQVDNPLKIATEGRVTLGDPKAPVAVVEYFDFQCPFCSTASERMKKLVKDYEGKVKVVYKHFPLGFHDFAEPSAVYFEAIAMEDHSKARKFHDLIFDEKNFNSKYKRLSARSPEGKKKMDKALEDLVKESGADLAAVKKNLEKAKAIVESDKEEAQKAGVGGTPSFIVNGVLVPRGKTPREIVDLLLERQGS